MANKYLWAIAFVRWPGKDPPRQWTGLRQRPHHLVTFVGRCIAIVDCAKKCIAAPLHLLPLSRRILLTDYPRQLTPRDAQSRKGLTFVLDLIECRWKSVWNWNRNYLLRKIGNKWLGDGKQIRDIVRLSCSIWCSLSGLRASGMAKKWRKMDSQ